VRDEESRDAVLGELRDRFGPVPESVMALVRAAWLRHLGEAAGASEVKLSGHRAEFAYRRAPDGMVKKVFKASGEAHRFGAELEADIKEEPRLKLKLPPGVSGQELFEASAAVLRALS